MRATWCFHRPRDHVLERISQTRFRKSVFSFDVFASKRSVFSNFSIPRVDVSVECPDAWFFGSRRDPHKNRTRSTREHRRRLEKRARLRIADVLIRFVVLFRRTDARTKDWFLMSSPLPTALICAAYVFTVKYAGPRMMANRKPMELRNVLIAYNLFQVIFSSWLFYEVSRGLMKREHDAYTRGIENVVKAIVPVRR